ncbi:MAG: S49 family peptidase [Saprospiraceae bacterium]
MNQFLKFVLASCLGVTLAIGAIFGILILVGISAGSSSQKSVDVKPNTVLELNFDQNILELTNNTKRDPFAFEEDIVGLQDMVRTIKKAESDKNIKGILIKPESVGRGIATSAVLRDALKEFKNSGKFIIAYSKWYSQGDYYMASVADEVYLHPMGSVDFRGFVAVVPFFKEAMDKIGVKYDVFYAGDFKSATEPFRRNDMSPQNKLQLREFLEEMNGLFWPKLEPVEIFRLQLWIAFQVIPLFRMLKWQKEFDSLIRLATVMRFWRTCEIASVWKRTRILNLSALMIILPV